MRLSYVDCVIQTNELFPLRMISADLGGGNIAWFAERAGEWELRAGRKGRG